MCNNKWEFEEDTQGFVTGSEINKLMAAGRERPTWKKAKKVKHIPPP
jgi:hypothetical protein